MNQTHTPAKVIELVLPPGPAPAHSDTGISYWPIALVLALCLALAIVLRRRAALANPADAAFRSLGRRSGLNAGDRRAIQEISGNIHPVALLLSPHALQRALDAAGNDQRAALAARKLARR